MLAYTQVSTLLTAIVMIIVGIVFGILASFEFGRKLLEKVSESSSISALKKRLVILSFTSQYPKIFSLGVFDHDGPTKEEMDKTSFSITLVGRGWSEKLAEPTDVHTTAPEKELVVRVSGPEPGYVATPICMVQAALVIIRDTDKLPEG